LYLWFLSFRNITTEDIGYLYDMHVTDKLTINTIQKVNSLFNILA